MYSFNDFFENRLNIEPPAPRRSDNFLRKTGFSPSAQGGICPHHRINRRSGSIRSQKGHDLHSVEKSQPLHVVAGRHHRHREMDTGLTGGTDHLATHLLNPRVHVLYSSASISDATTPSLLASDKDLFFWPFRCVWPRYPLALQPRLSLSGRLTTIRVDNPTRVRRIKCIFEVAAVSRAGSIGDDLLNELVFLVDIDLKLVAEISLAVLLV